MDRKELAVELFKQGYNCSQSVFVAYSDLFDIDKDTALRLSSSFGGGMGRMREVCGAVSGMFMLAGLQSGTTDAKDTAGKKANYDVVRKLADEYKEKNGSIICRELLGINSENPAVSAAAISGSKPEDRTKEYYKKRPCVGLIRDAAEIVENYLKERGKL